jgi:hypothetical protein
MDRWYGYKAKGEQNWRGSDDRKQALTCALKLSDGDTEAAELLVKWGERRAEVMVGRTWPQVHKLAFALLEHGKLSGDQVRDLLGGQDRNGEQRQ